MFGELPKLFDRNFAVGYFLPVAIFITLSGFILGRYEFAPSMVSFLASDLLIGTTVLGLLSWVGGIFLLAINRDLYRLMEGYGKYNPIRLFGRFEKNRYQKIITELDRLDDEFRKSLDEDTEFPAKSKIKRNNLMRQMAEEFPDREEFLLPTPFGNVLRSFEVYPRVMFGLEAIDGWARLLAVVTKDYVDLIDSTKAQVDFWVNLGLMFVLLEVEYIGLSYIFGNQLNWLFVFVLVALGTFAPLRATSSAKEWGDAIKSAFDMFIPAMRESLGFDLPKSREEEKRQWINYSQAIVYRLPEKLPNIKKNTFEKTTRLKKEK